MCSKTLSRQWKDKPQKRKKKLQIRSDKGLVARRKNFYDFNKKADFKEGKKNIWIDIFLKTVDKRPISTWKDTHYQSLGKGKPKPQYHFTSRKMTVKAIEVLAEYWEIRILILSYRNIKWSSHFLENHLTVSQYLNRITIWLCNSTPNHIPNRTENVHPHKNLHMNVHSGIFYNMQKVETMSINW